LEKVSAQARAEEEAKRRALADDLAAEAGSRASEFRVSTFRRKREAGIITVLLTSS
jgi:hypothetical protein